MKAEEAWKILTSTIKNIDAETAYENDNYFVFSLKPKGAPVGSPTGLYVYAVNKVKKVVEALSVGDEKLIKNVTFIKMLDAAQFK